MTVTITMSGEEYEKYKKESDFWKERYEDLITSLMNNTTFIEDVEEERYVADIDSEKAISFLKEYLEEIKNDI